MTSIDSILAWFREQIEEKNVISNSQWLDSASRLNILSQDLDDELADYECSMAEVKVNLIKEEKVKSKTEADCHVQATPQYNRYLKLKAKRERGTPQKLGIVS